MFKPNSQTETYAIGTYSPLDFFIRETFAPEDITNATGVIYRETGKGYLTFFARPYVVRIPKSK